MNLRNSLQICIVFLVSLLVIFSLASCQELSKEDIASPKSSNSEQLDLSWVDAYLENQGEDFGELPARYEVFFQEFIEKYRFRYPLLMGRIQTAGSAQFDDNLFLEVADERFQDAESIYAYLAEIYAPGNRQIQLLKEKRSFRDHDGKTYIIAADAPFNLAGLEDAVVQISEDEAKAVISYALHDPSPVSNDVMGIVHLFLEKLDGQWLIVDQRIINQR